MTSAPIMWFACFDFEKKRKRNVKNMKFDWGEDNNELKAANNVVQNEGGQFEKYLKDQMKEN